MDKKIIYEDLYRYYGNKKFKNFLKGIFFNPGFQYTYFHRKANLSRFILSKFLFNFLLKISSVIWHFQIPKEVQIGSGLYIGHFGSIVINPKTIIGKNVNIHQGITIGQTNRGEKKGVPIIGNNVWIGTNAVIVGKIKIGNNVLIAPNSYINFDIPDNSVVIGNPAKIINNIEATKDYINNTI